MDVVAEGWVMQVTPLLVRFAGDTGDTAIAVQDDGLTFSLGEKVGLTLFPSGWTITAKLVAT